LRVRAEHQHGERQHQHDPHFLIPPDDELL
jgi:hypothetical protein